MLTVFSDIRHAARTLRRNAGFAVTTIAVLSLGIAANTAIFSVVNKVLLEPLPYPDPNRLVQLMSKSPLGDQAVVSIPKYLVWHDHALFIQDIAAYDTTGPSVNLTEGERSIPLPTARVSSEYFTAFGGSAMLGRTFASNDDQPTAPLVAMISHNLWRTRFRSDPALVGSLVSFDHEQYKIVGVLSPRFPTEKPFDLWLPLRAKPSGADHISRVRVVARLHPGVDVKAASQDIAGTMRWFIRQYPNAPLLFQEEFAAVPLRDALVGDVRPALFLLSGAVGFLLLIACANVASLVLARATRRAAEVAVRAALGASRKQLVRHLLTESMLIASVSSLVGLALGYLGVRGLLVLSPADLPRVGANGSAIAVDWRVFLFTLAVSLASGVLFGLLPALKASRTDLTSLVNETALQSGMGFRRSADRAVLVISEVALALVLLTGAGLLIRTFVATRTISRGFDEQHVLTVQMSLGGPYFARTVHVAELIHNVEHRMKQTPGVMAVATTSSLPLEPTVPLPFTVTRHDQTMVGRYHGAAPWRSVSPGYFDALQIRLLRGRLFTNDDNEHAARVVLINRMMMRKFWPEIDANPIGEFIIIGKGMRELEDTPRQIVGIVSDVREAGLNREPMMYVPVAQLTDAITARDNRVLPVTWVIRTASDGIPQGFIEHSLREASGLPLGVVRTMHDVVAASSARATFYVLLLAVFSGVALLLAAAGLYGVLSYSVQQRTREIGLRMALGAGPGNIRNMVVWQGMRLALMGIGIGIPAALALTRVLVSMIFGIQPWDPLVMTVVCTLLTGIAFLAAYLPSLRATAVNPSDSLRH
ncbi:MAG TPA: ABC transporter permease [Bryobacteraceae bacterium]|nr:ABC transporter permease [Bryobacteraceae bacterium]